VDTAKATEVVPDTTVATLVARGVELDRREGDLKWEWGDLMLEVAPGTGRGGALRAVGETIPERIAAYVVELGEVGVVQETRTLELYRATSDAWSKDTRGSFGWRVGYELRGQSDRLELVEGHTFNVAQARELVSIRTTVKTDCTLEDFKDWLAAHAANPELTAAEFFAIEESEKAAEVITALALAQDIEVPVGSLADMNATQERWLRTYIDQTRKLLEAIERELSNR